MPSAGAVCEWETENSTETWAFEPPLEDSSSPKESDLAEEIAHARRLLEFADDEDGEGSSVYSSATLDSAVKFITSYADDLHQQYGLRIPVPSIGPGPKASVDLHWRTESWEMLINIPEGDGSVASFYGDNYGTQTIRGTFNPSVFNLGIVNWLLIQ